MVPYPNYTPISFYATCKAKWAMLNHIWATSKITSQKISKQHSKFHKNYILNRGHSTSYMSIFMPFGLVELCQLNQQVKACKSTTKLSHNMSINFNPLVKQWDQIRNEWDQSQIKAIHVRKPSTKFHIHMVRDEHFTSYVSLSLNQNPKNAKQQSKMSIK